MIHGGRFGEVAEVYDDARPDFAPAFAEEIGRYHGEIPGTVLEIGAGTGKGTAILARLGGGTVLDLRGSLALARRPA